MNAVPKMRKLYLTVERVAERYGVSTDSIWRWNRNGTFPAPVRIGSNCTRWLLSDFTEHDSKLKRCFMTHLDGEAAA